ncbi:MAG: riboflavin biosynthesis protein RibF [Clostridia bacterium]|nr:riboflavin biosynthesis protein RibF [Clostridia bacterium]
MNVVYYSYPSALELGKIAVALGYFDGVHVGHRELISLLVREARAKGLSPYVLTFADSLSKTKKTQSIIYNTEEKIKIFSSLGVEGVIVTDFSSISGLSPESFIGDVLVDSLGVELAISGYNFRFGKGAAADSLALVELMEKAGKSAIILSEQKIDGKPLSATVIRDLISEKRLEEATRMLGLPYAIEGEVERGLGLGKAYGFPTVNLPLRRTSPLSTGVYRTAVIIDGRAYTGVTNVGSCPTVSEREIHTETLIADFEGDLYGKTVRIYFLGYLREEKRFDSIEELRDRIYLDKDIAKKENGDLLWLETGLN